MDSNLSNWDRASGYGTSPEQQRIRLEAEVFEARAEARLAWMLAMLNTIATFLLAWRAL